MLTMKGSAYPLQDWCTGPGPHCANDVKWPKHASHVWLRTVIQHKVVVLSTRVGTADSEKLLIHKAPMWHMHT